MIRNLSSDGEAPIYGLMGSVDNIDPVSRPLPYPCGRGFPFQRMGIFYTVQGCLISGTFKA